MRLSSTTHSLHLGVLWYSNIYLIIHLIPYRCTWSMIPVFSRVRIAHVLLLLCMYDFIYYMFFVVYVCFPCLVFVPGIHSFDYRYTIGSLDYSLITAILLVPLITLWLPLYYWFPWLLFQFIILLLSSSMLKIGDVILYNMNITVKHKNHKGHKTRL